MKRDKGHRGASVDNTKPVAAKVEKIELNEKHIPLRLVLFIVVILIGITAFGIFFSSLLNANPGWMVIEEANTNYPSIGQDFILNYYVPKTNPTEAKKKIVSVYSDIVEKALILFDELNEYEGFNNVYYINHHVNEEIEVDPVLYNAFKKINDANSQIIYLGPIYSQYRNIMSSENNNSAKEFDPKYNDEMKTYFSEILSFVNDSDISISLLENNTIKLNINDNYLEYATQNGIDLFIDFWTLKNAFACDYMANTLFENGITGFILSSNDGYNYSVGCDEELGLEIWTKDGKAKNLVGRLSFSGTNTFVTFTSSPLEINTDKYYIYYENDDASKAILDITSRYVSTVDGIAREASKTYYGYSKDAVVGCADIAMGILDVFISDNIDTSKVEALKNSGIYSLYLDASGNVVSNLPDTVTFTKASLIYGE